VITCKHCGAEVEAKEFIEGFDYLVTKDGSLLCLSAPLQQHEAADEASVEGLNLDWRKLANIKMRKPNFWDRHRSWLIPVIAFVVGYVFMQLANIFYLNR
jgi:hypothetical protein